MADASIVIICAVARGALAASAVNEDSAHRLGSSAKEVRAAVPFLIFIADQPQPGFVDERGGLQGLAGCFVRHLVRGQPS